MPVRLSIALVDIREPFRFTRHSRHAPGELYRPRVRLSRSESRRVPSCRGFDRARADHARRILSTILRGLPDKRTYDILPSSRRRFRSAFAIQCTSRRANLSPGRRLKRRVIARRLTSVFDGPPSASSTTRKRDRLSKNIYYPEARERENQREKKKKRERDRGEGEKEREEDTTDYGNSARNSVRCRPDWNGRFNVSLSDYLPVLQSLRSR